MEFLVFIALLGGLFYFWNRTADLERRLRQLEGLVAGLQFQLGNLASGKGEPQPQLAATRAKAAAAARVWQKPEPPIPSEPEEDAAPEPEPAPEAVTEPADEAVADVPEIEPQPQPEPASVVQAEAPAEPGHAYAPVYADADEPAGARFAVNFENLFGRLAIWAGGVTLAVAGFFLVRYSIENGLLGPKVRVALGFLFGGGLLAAGELAYRNAQRVLDPRVQQALSNAGLATLYASFYFAGTQYGLIGSSIAFLGLAGVTGAAILLSFRYGLPSAILGLVGGFAAPMLIDSDSANLPLLALYLALVTGGLSYAGNRQGRSWLALAALAGGLGWGALMLFSGITGYTDVLALGGYLVVMGAIIPALTEGPDAGPAAGPWVRTIAATLAALQLAVMVEQAGYSVLAWGHYGLLAAALSYFAWKDARLRPATAFAALLAALMLALWTSPDVTEFVLVSAGLLAVFAGIPLALIYRGSREPVDIMQVSGFALALIAVLYGKFGGEGHDVMVGLASLAIAMLPALATYLLWPARDEAVSRNGMIGMSAAALGIAVAGLIATPAWAAPLVLAAVTMGLIALGWTREDKPLVAIMWTGAVATFFSLGLVAGSEGEFQRLGGVGSEGDVLRSALRWAASASVFVALSLRKPMPVVTAIAEAAAVALSYGFLAQFVPGQALAWIAAAGAIALGLGQPNRISARSAAAVIAVLWTVEPVGIWMMHGIPALAGDPMLISGDLGWADITLRIIPGVAGAASLLLRSPRDAALVRAWARLAVGIIAMIGAHIAYKQIFALDTEAGFVALGMAERTIWQALLLGTSIAIARRFAQQVWSRHTAIALAGAAALHFTVFSLMLHNPLLDEQHVGAMPIINMLLASYAVALALVWWLGKQKLVDHGVPRWAGDVLSMALISCLALSELRQIFSGTDLTAVAVFETEQLLRSLLGIVLAILFLIWGSRAQSRSWRIGSLVLMLGAVLKVFLYDASGLEGLMRIGSFVALGFSLIGIGWFYARQLAGTGVRQE